MELMILGTILRRWWWLILIPTLIAGAVTLPALLSRAPTAGSYGASFSYSAMQSLEAIPRQDGDYQDLWLSSELLVNAFTDWVRGSRFKDEIVEAAARDGLMVDPALLGIGADNERSVGQVFFSYPDGLVLERIAVLAENVLRERSGAYFAQLGGESAAVTILSRSPAAPAPPLIVDRFAPFIRIGLGVIAGLGLALLAHYLDPIVRRREDVEALGLVVVASIPKR